MIVRNLRTGSVVAGRVGRADNLITRGVGLLGRAALDPDEGLWIVPCSSIHTMGMRAVIDVFFLDKQGAVLRIVPAAKPGRLLIACKGAHAVLELGASGSPERGVATGDRLTIE